MPDSKITINELMNKSTQDLLRLQNNIQGILDIRVEAYFKENYPNNELWKVIPGHDLFGLFFDKRNVNVPIEIFNKYK